MYHYSQPCCQKCCAGWASVSYSINTLVLLRCIQCVGQRKVCCHMWRGVLASVTQVLFHLMCVHLVTHLAYVTKVVSKQCLPSFYSRQCTCFKPRCTCITCLWWMRHRPCLDSNHWSIPCQFCIKYCCTWFKHRLLLGKKCIRIKQLRTNLMKTLYISLGFSCNRIIYKIVWPVVTTQHLGRSRWCGWTVLHASSTCQCKLCHQIN